MEERKIRYSLRAYRRIFRLSQEEMATLVGLNSRVHVSRIEQGRRDPSFSTALAYAALFKVSLCELFPHNTTEVKSGLWERAQTLSEEVRDSDAPYAAHKANFLGAVPQVASHPHRRHYDV